MARALVALAGVAVVMFGTTGCTIREECIDHVTTTTKSELGFARLERCGIGHCMSLQRLPWGPGLRFRLPTEPGTVSLEELEAVRCSFIESDTSSGDRDCQPLTGTLVVRAVHPPAEGQPVGRLDADLNGATIDYREQYTPVCHDVDWPDVSLPGFPGPGQL